MDYEQIKYEIKDGILTVTLNRPDKLNAFTGRMLSELLDDDGSRRSRRRRPRHRLHRARPRLLRRRRSFRRRNTFNAENIAGRSIPASTAIATAAGLFTLRLYDVLKPTIAACNGTGRRRRHHHAACHGHPAGLRGGALWLRVHERRAIVMEACSSWFLPRLVGPQQALEWVMTGRVFPAEEALRGRLVRSIHKPDELLPAAYALAREIADNTAPVSVALNRQMIWKMLGADHPMEAHKVDSKGNLRPRQVGRRQGRRHGLPREAAGQVPHESDHRHAILLPVVAGADLQVSCRPGGACGKLPANIGREEKMTKLHVRRRRDSRRSAGSRCCAPGWRSLRGACPGRQAREDQGLCWRSAASRRSTIWPSRSPKPRASTRKPGSMSKSTISRAAPSRSRALMGG